MEDMDQNFPAIAMDLGVSPNVDERPTVVAKIIASLAVSKPAKAACQGAPETKILDGHFHLNRLLGGQATVSDMLQMPLPRAPNGDGELTGGVWSSVIRIIRRAVHVSRFAAAVGLHPKHATRWNNQQVQAFRCLQRTPHTKVLGEVGIALSARDVPMQEQVLQSLLRRFADPARPVILHLRGRKGREDEVYNRAFKLVSPILSREQPILLHCFSGGTDIFQNGVRDFLTPTPATRGWCLFSQTAKTQGLREVPSDRLLFERDAPYLFTLGKGTDNTPHHNEDVAALVANARQGAVTEVVAAANGNLRSLFQL
ncbi:3'-5' ssDNA/RNA exonuclease tatd [Plakobranchus ocellatus]|uniref:3'-5' ssDNA/RNA exonuclease tatd n=1 Tax=Plakobranchus ocellatus TaxID=259542 RepID=A0AAV3ZIT5_9GAST|nr:3'-5' ssDNA/RNA exonuclease tatd [Plakobranchus ocellatus]